MFKLDLQVLKWLLREFFEKCDKWNDGNTDGRPKLLFPLNIGSCPSDKPTIMKVQTSTLADPKQHKNHTRCSQRTEDINAAFFFRCSCVVGQVLKKPNILILVQLVQGDYVILHKAQFTWLSWVSYNSDGPTIYPD